MLLRHLSPQLLPAAAHGCRLRHDSHGETGLDPGEDLRGARARQGGPAYTAVMTELSLPNYIGARIQLRSNLRFPEWEALAHTLENNEVISFLKHGFPRGYEGPVPKPATHNNASAVQHPRDVTAYVLTKMDEGAMLGPFDMEQFIPWCQVNPLPTRPQQYSYICTVIMDLSWPPPPPASV